MTGVRVLTPSGRAAIAVVEVVGPEACHLVDRCFAPASRRAVADTAIDAVAFGRWLPERSDPSEAEAAGEEIVVVRTAEDRVEVHCHGGPTASAAIVGDLAQAGAEPAADAPPSTLGEEAHRLLREAPTERVAGVLLDQAAGALVGAVESLLRWVEAGDWAGARAAIDRLLATERIGTRLLEPWRVVLAGEPNVGKSSLINALVGYQRAIVYDLPGTTRDVVTAATAIRGWPVTLADTAGIRDTQEPLEAAGATMARRAVAEADVVVLVGEAAHYRAPDAELRRDAIAAAAAANAVVLRVANKADLCPPSEAGQGVIATSARDGFGIAALIDAVAQSIEPEPLAPGAPVVFRAWQAQRLRAARAAADLRDARRAAAELQALLAPGSVATIGES
ncbi:GTPase [Botrimarina sp.]|uniref:GTPase n=1 Tax=Botrimarina sp. TaxID=2795802 RepID=UPI0032EAE965